VATLFSQSTHYEKLGLIKLTACRCRRARMKIRAQRFDRCRAIIEAGAFSERWNVPSGPDVSYSSAALSY
jgi:hypothetical protein